MVRYAFFDTILNYYEHNTLKQHLFINRSWLDSSRFYASSPTKPKSRYRQYFIPFWRLKGRIHFQAHSGFWQNPVPCYCRTEIPVSLLHIQSSFSAFRVYAHSLACVLSNFKVSSNRLSPFMLPIFPILESHIFCLFLLQGDNLTALKGSWYSYPNNIGKSLYLNFYKLNFTCKVDFAI